MSAASFNGAKTSKRNNYRSTFIHSSRLWLRDPDDLTPSSPVGTSAHTPQDMGRPKFVKVTQNPSGLDAGSDGFSWESLHDRYIVGLVSDTSIQISYASISCCATTNIKFTRSHVSRVRKVAV